MSEARKRGREEGAAEAAGTRDSDAPARRRRRTRFEPAPTDPTAPAAPATSVPLNFSAAAGSAAQQASLMQQRIQEQIASVTKLMSARTGVGAAPAGQFVEGQGPGPGLGAARPPAPPGSAANRFVPPPLLLNQEGKQVDASGREVRIEGPQATIKFNQREREQERRNPYLEQEVGEGEEVEEVDPRVHTRSRETKKRKSLRFVQHGKFLKRGEAMRAREARRAIHESVRVLKGKTAGQSGDGGGDGEAAGGETAQGEAEAGQREEGCVPNVVGETAQAAERKRASRRLPPPRDDALPVMEWWDAMFLPKGQRAKAQPSGPGSEPNFVPEYGNLALTNQKTHIYVEHPVPMRPYSEAPEPEALPMMLTKKERQRIRRQTRRERQREVQDMVQLGLMPPPPPKVKLSNMMRVMGDQAVLTPSEIERKVREETEKRKQNHAMRNVAGKLTPEERREKWRSKFEEGEAEEIDMALYRVNDLGDTLHRFKIDKNAQYMQLTGRVILCTTQRCNMVLVEGVPAGIRKFNKLMLRRIRWNERSADLDAEERGEEVPTRPNNQCHLVWRGSASRRAFLGFRFIEAANSEEARRALEPNGAGPYWDMVEQYDPEAHEGLDVL